jgi:hypothetical protein
MVTCAYVATQCNGMLPHGVQSIIHAEGCGLAGECKLRQISIDSFTNKAFRLSRTAPCELCAHHEPIPNKVRPIDSPPKTNLKVVRLYFIESVRNTVQCNEFYARVWNIPIWDADANSIFSLEPLALHINVYCSCMRNPARIIEDVVPTDRTGDYDKKN